MQNYNNTQGHMKNLLWCSLDEKRCGCTWMCRIDKTRWLDIHRDINVPFIITCVLLIRLQIYLFLFEIYVLFNLSCWCNPVVYIILPLKNIEIKKIIKIVRQTCGKIIYNLVCLLDA